LRNTNEHEDFQNTKAEADRLELQGRMGKTGKNRVEESLRESFLKKPHSSYRQQASVQ